MGLTAASGIPFNLSFFVSPMSFFFFLEDIVVLVSGVQQSDAFMHTHMSLLSRFFSLIGYYKILSPVPCAAQ